MNGVANLGSTLEEGRKEILKQKEELNQMQSNYASQTTNSARETQQHLGFTPRLAQMSDSSKSNKQPPISASQLADDALSAPFNINNYLSDHGLDQQDFPTGSVKTEQVAGDSEKKKTKSSISVAEQASTTNTSNQYAPNFEPTPQSVASTENSGAQAVPQTAPQASPQPTPQPTPQPAAPTEDISKKVTDNVNGSTGPSVAVAETVEQKPEEKSSDGKLTNSEIMNMINQVADPASAQASGAPGAPVVRERPAWAGSGFRVDLNNEDGAGYVGTIYLGSEDQPAKVLFDTGSDFLAVTSDLCLDPSLGKQE